MNFNLYRHFSLGSFLIRQLFFEGIWRFLRFVALFQAWFFIGDSALVKKKIDKGIETHGYGSKRKPLGTAGFGLFLLPIGFFRYLFLTHSHIT